VYLRQSVQIFGSFKEPLRGSTNKIGATPGHFPARHERAEPAIAFRLAWKLAGGILTTIIHSGALPRSAYGKQFKNLRNVELSEHLFGIDISGLHGEFEIGFFWQSFQ
jgi:hypothetical protein